MTSVSQSEAARDSGSGGRRPTAVLASASLDAYGSDLQLVESAAALLDAGWRVVVVASRSGRARDRLISLGAELVELEFPVLMRSHASFAGLARLIGAAVKVLPGMVRALRRHHAALVYVNTLTIPWWLLAGRLARVPSLCHVHEAEARDPLVVRLVLAAPLLLANRVVVNSRTTESTVAEIVPGLRRRTRLVYNGVEPPPQRARVADRSEPPRLVVVGRISPRKSPQTALEAVEILRRRGRDVRLDVCGTAADGADGFQADLQRRSERPDLAGAVTFTGYASPIWPALERADIVVAPSLGESFGNAVVEAQLACRPVIATAVQGHLETVSDGETGLLVPCGDAAAVADAVTKLLDDPDYANRLATNGQSSALEKFTSTRYRAEIVAEVSVLAGRQVRT